MSRRRIAVTLAIVVASLLGLYALAGFVILPRWAERHAGTMLGPRLGVDVQVDDVHFNPFLLRVVARNLRIDAQGERLLSAEESVADLSWASLWRRGWWFSTLTLHGAQARLQIERDGQLNWAALLPERSADATKTATRLHFDQMRVHSGRVQLIDLRGAAPASVQLTEVDATVDHLASFAHDHGNAEYTISATLEAGGTLRGEGTLALQPHVQSSGTLGFSDVDGAALWPLLRAALPLAIETPAQRISAQGRYRFSAAADQPELQIDLDQWQLRQVALRVTGSDAPLLQLDALSGSGGRLNLQARELKLAELKLHSGAIRAAIDEQGRLDWLALADARAADAADAAPRPGDARPWRVQLDAVVIDGVALHVTDRSRQPALQLDVAAIGGTAGLQATFGAGPISWRVERLDARLDRPKLGSSAAADGGAAGPVQLAFDSLAVHGGSVDGGERRVRAERISATGGQLAIELGAGAAPTASPAQRPNANANATNGRDAASGQPDAGGETTAAWQYAVGSVQLTGVSLDLQHSGYSPAIVYRAELTRATLGNAASAAEQAMSLNAQLALADGGSLRLTGTIAQDASSADVDMQLDALPLLPLQPLLASQARVRLRSGTLSADAQLTLRRSAAAGIELHAAGSAGLKGLRVDEAGSGDRLLSWQTMQADRVEFDSAERRLTVGKIEVFEPGAKLVIAEDRSVNLMRLTNERPAAAGPRAAPQQRSFEVVVDRVKLRGGVLDFADLSLVLPFSTRITELDGAIVGISSRPGQRATVEAAGQIGDYGSARFSGSLLPWAPQQFLDIDAVMENVEIPPFSPYTATFAGRKVAEGKLWLDLDYRIENRQLLGKNQIRLSDFRLGERVEAPRALDLPLDMAVALLKDERGTIQLSLPVSGDLGRPAVDVAALVREALGNVLQRIVSAPFRALARLFGNGSQGDELGQIEFVAGSATLAPPQRERLQTVARAIAQRPQLRLVVDGPYAPQLDARALQRRAARAELARLLGDEPLSDTAPSPVAYTSQNTRAALETLYARVAGEPALAALRAEWSAPTVQGGAAPASAAGAAGPAGAGAAMREGFYPALFEGIVERMPIVDAGLQRLAAQRAAAIRDYLVREAGAPAERVRTGKLDPVQGRDGRIVAAALEFDAVEAPEAPVGPQAAVPVAER